MQPTGLWLTTVLSGDDRPSAAYRVVVDNCVVRRRPAECSLQGCGRQLCCQETTGRVRPTGLWLTTVLSGDDRPSAAYRIVADNCVVRRRPAEYGLQDCG